jgi:serine/threonine protein kinase
MVLRTRTGKKMAASYTIDIFALGMMIIDIFSGFTFYQQEFSKPEYCDFNRNFDLPPSIPQSFKEKLLLMVSKDRSRRITISKFAESQVFKDLSTTQKYQLGIENMQEKFDTLTMQLSKDSLKLDCINTKLDDVTGLLDEINSKLDRFLPAIQQNLLDIMATEAVPGI